MNADRAGSTLPTLKGSHLGSRACYQALGAFHIDSESLNEKEGVTMLIELLAVTCQVVLIWLAADMCSGLIHWVQDHYKIGRSSILSRIVILYAKEHHEFPGDFTRLTWWQRNSYAGIAAVAALLVLGSFGLLYWQVAAFLLILLFSGEIHFWSHRAMHENGIIINTMQKLRVIQRPEHHALHHNGEADYNCIVTDFMNPLLKKLGLFPFLEKVIFAAFGINADDSYDSARETTGLQRLANHSSQ